MLNHGPLSETSVVSSPGNNTSERLDTWYHHFKNLLGTEHPDIDLNDPFFNIHISDTLPMRCDPFSLEELNVVFKSIKTSKGPDLDNIPPVVWKEESLKSELLYFCNQTLIDGIVSEEWITSALIPVSKKCDLSKPDNYLGIALSPIAAKIFNKLLLNRIVPHIEPLLRDN